MGEEADLSAYADCLCSCHVVIEKLRAKAVMTLDETQHGLAYLQLQERRWPSEPMIADSAELYLDDLSTRYLQTIGALDALKRAGLTAYITEDEDNDANRLIRYENLSNKQLDIIDTVRKTLAEGLKSGRVRAVRARAPGDEKFLKTHPTFGLLGLEEPVDGLVVDDRFVNRHLYMDGSAGRISILSTLDVLDDLAERGAISTDDMFKHRIKLRQAGFQFVPITEAELAYHLKNAPYVDGALTETAELRAIRESVLKARMNKLLQIPVEVPWLHQSMNAIIKTIKALWTQKADLKEAAAYSEWLLPFIDLRGWAPSALPGNERNFALYAHAAHVQSVASAPDGATDDVRNAYYEWIDERLIAVMKDTEPEMFAWIVARAKEMIASAVNDAVEEFGT